MKKLAILLLMVLPALALAQPESATGVDPAKIADELTAFQDDESNYEEQYENLLQMFSSRIDLNNTSQTTLQTLNVLSDLQIQNLFEHISRHGALLSIYELQTIEGMDVSTIQKLLPFITVQPPDEQINRALLRRILTNDNNYMVFRTSRSVSPRFPRQQFPVTSDQVFMRMRCSKTNDFSLGVTLENDAGEKLSFQPEKRQLGFDHTSFHIQLMKKGRIENFILGDFQFQFGQGVVLGNGFGFGKGSETITSLRKVNVGYTPYTSSGESGFMRGAAATYRLGNDLYFSPFYSNVFRDGSIGESDSSISSFITSGSHRTEAELMKRKNVQESCYGGVVHFNRRQLEAGAVFQQISFSLPLMRNASAYNQFQFRGAQNINTGFFLNYTFHNVSFFAEAARSLTGGAAFISGALMSLGPQWDASLALRKYDADYYPFYANALSENTLAQNETGFYFGLKYRINKRYTFAAYLDLFRFPWLRFRSYGLSNGSELLFRFNYQPTRKSLIYIQFRQERKARNIPAAESIYQVSEAIKQNAAFNFEYEISPTVKLQSPCQFSNFFFLKNKSQGIAFMQDVVVSLGSLKISARHALFDTDDYDNRQYAYEKDVWLAYSFPAYYGTGTRSYIMFDYKFSKRVSTSLRYSRTTSVSNIAATIPRNDVKLQGIYRF